MKYKLNRHRAQDIGSDSLNVEKELGEGEYKYSYDEVEDSERQLLVEPRKSIIGSVIDYTNSTKQKYADEVELQKKYYETSSGNLYDLHKERTDEFVKKLIPILFWSVIGAFAWWLITQL